MFHLLRPTLSCVAAAALLASCTTTSAEKPIPLPEGRWELITSSFIDGGRIPGIPRATLQLRDGHIAAFSGCNSGTGTAAAEDGKLAVAALATTRRACPEPVGAFEGRYFKLLRDRPYFRTEGDMLILAAGNDSARFRRVSETPAKK